uniref:carbonic anhydrase n=1 Tax=Candidatus Kentrum sp. TUN TaxID=2126343 RepID=A0A451AT76_9GAMM|nr:MAG: carbonic anhydrase [Candidatus Kentron sp. TUN]VFK69239.1 MAG: carbonic anhydrase [Candidatus Kentron sp. TUN]
MKKGSFLIALTASATLAFGSLSCTNDSNSDPGRISYLESGHEHEHSWHYEGADGPEHWGNLSEEFALCKTGKAQSPIDIKGPTKRGVPSLDVQYHTVTSLKVFNNGHTLKESFDNPVSHLLIDGKSYDLLQFHFHSPSEHQIAGKAASMEVHLVHQNADKELAVIGVMIEEGKEHKALKAIWERIPQKAGEETIASGEFNATMLLPKDRAFFHYTGSLTTPPCSEQVRWFVMRNSIELSHEQIQKFKDTIGHSIRPVQPLNGRTIFASK